MGAIFISLWMLAWFLIISAMLALLATRLVCWQHNKAYQLLSVFSQLFSWPVILLAPLTLMLGFRLLAIDLTFPSSLDSTWFTQLVFLAMPGTMLVISSNFLPFILKQLKHDHLNWLDFNFVKFGISIGKSPPKQLAPLVFTKSLLSGWVKCLPWAFGELIVIESICNIPGLGYSLWMALRQRNSEDALFLLIILLAIYSLLAFTTLFGQRWLGEKLAGY